jgi:NADH-quinone oxidoreductase subunit G
LREVGFLVSLEMLHSPVTELADVVLPVAPDVQRSGTYLNWEGRATSFGPALDASGVLPDCRVLDTLAVEMDVDLFTQTPAAAAGELARLGPRSAASPAGPTVAAGRPRAPGFGQAVLATWRQLVDNGSLSIDEPHLAGTARPALARVNPATAARLGLVEGEPATVRTERGAITLPVAFADLPDGVVWLPGNSGGSRVRAVLGAGHGSLVGVTA